MGDRISISFKHKEWESVALFSHWGGREFLNQALDYLDELKKEQKDDSTQYPLDRLEPQTVMVDFIRWITGHMDRVNSNLYLGKDAMDGDNSDNGHFTIDLETGRFT
jgi:hypothetical protein